VISQYSSNVLDELMCFSISCRSSALNPYLLKVILRAPATLVCFTARSARWPWIFGRQHALLDQHGVIY
jgi:hypothetical protein